MIGRGSANRISAKLGATVPLPRALANVRSPQIALSSSTLAFSSNLGGPNPPCQSITISNAGDGSLAWSAAANQPWISVNPTTGSAGQSTTICASTTTLAMGQYVGSVSIAAAGAANSPASVSIAVNVGEPCGDLEVPGAPQVSYTSGNLNPTAGSTNQQLLFTIRNPNAASRTFNWSATSSNTNAAQLTTAAGVVRLGPGGSGSGTVSFNAVTSPQSAVVSLTATDSGRAVNQGAASATVVVAAANHAPTASFTASPNPANRGTAVILNGGNSTDPDNDPLTYSWTFGDGTTASGTSSTSHLYVPGSYTAWLKVTDGRGGADSVSQSITVRNYNQVVLADAPLWYFDFDGSTAPFWSTGTGYAYLNGYNPIISSPSLVSDNGHSLGLSTYLSYSYGNAASYNNPQSIELWLQKTGQMQNIVASPYISITYFESYGFQLGVSYNAGGYTLTAYSSWVSPISNGTKVYIVVVSNGSATVLYINGSAVATVPHVPWNGYMYPFTVGGYTTANVDAVAYYNKALTAAQIQAHYAAGT